MHIETDAVVNLAASLTGYYAKLDNLVVVTGRFPNLQLLNSGEAINRGIEPLDGVCHGGQFHRRALRGRDRLSDAGH
jgi:hypothetical protein